MKNRLLPAAYLCGDLNMLRCFGDLEARTVVVSSDPADLTFSSRFCKEVCVVSDVERDPEAVLVELERAGGSEAVKPVLFYGTDAMLLLVSRNRARLGAKFSFLMPGAELIEALVDKNQFGRLAPVLGIRVPRTLASRDVSSADEIARELPFPCVLKPKQHTGWSRSDAVRAAGGRPRK